MQKIVIKNHGPVKDCKLAIKDFIICTGPQASGKSTVAKSIFFFKNLKNILYSQVRKKILLADSVEEENVELKTWLKFVREIRANFLQIFGTTWHMDKKMHLEYWYSKDIYIQISLKEGADYPNYIWVMFSPELKKRLDELDRIIASNENTAEEKLDKVRERIATCFEDEREVVYIPAGRSMITLLSNQLNYIYSSMDDAQKRNLDYCTQNYLERILQMKANFSFSIKEQIANKIHMTDEKVNISLFNEAANLMHEILQGEYVNRDGEERLQLENGKYVRINFASSGQQEVVWILNVLFYYLLNNKKIYFIIEEPESHLFPNAQKLIAEFIALVQKGGKSQVFITTHSPYILGTFNNLLYAHRISKYVDKKRLSEIIPESKWLDFEKVAALFIEHGNMYSCLNEEFESIQNEVIDGASEDINNDFDRMAELKEMFWPEEESYEYTV